ncbi:hypothetical protein SOM61_26370 [Massilia sp. CFBP9012]|uniref:hypothetical protein n=1 Tax=Massilia sp. CFBP9012 TaxID=3096531 RepID=UPI002A6AF008|nr:hypothetical protein [Massilia sp. CFBP9012]MDY0978491.1 hypothetical protein [Massilia sp. CFBP9012]
MKTDIDIYNELARMLIEQAPSEAVIIKLKFVVKIELSVDESGMNEFFFDYIDEAGEENWFGINDGRIVSKIGNLCLMLREKMKEGGQGVWSVLDFAVNLRGNNFSADFGYGEQ